MTIICKELKEVKVKEINKEAMEVYNKEVMEVYNKNKWKIVTLYSRNIEEILETIMEEIQKEEEGHLMMGGDFNARRRLDDS